MTSFELTGKIILINGASRGIGEAFAREFARRGATVIVASRKQEGCEAVARAIVEEGGQAVARACHTGDLAQVDALFEWIEAEYGRLDGLVNNAATNPYFGPFVEAPEAAFDKTFDVNVKGYFLMAQRAARLMIKAGGGSILNIASIEGISPSPMMAIYSMTKAAVIMMTKTIAKELGGAGVRCNCICPGLTETKFAKVLIDTPEIRDRQVGKTPLGRHAQPEEMAGAAVYLMSDAASFTTGAILTVDGGAVV
ncbi:MAG: glucose 1-dehydrogenase [Candidatus Hydrogenedentes bacterium]|nr:glucose 1-dehydrogenase [Candidatus Hydrogenedentota bacterium]